MYIETCLEWAQCSSDYDCGLSHKQLDKPHVIFAVYHLLYFPFALWSFSMLIGFQSKHPSNKFVYTACMQWTQLQRILSEVESLEMWRWQDH